MIQSNLSYQETITMVTEICCECGIAFGLPSDLQRHLKNDPNKYFHCPNGHSQRYAKSREQTLREEAERKLRQKENELAGVAAAKIQLEGELTKTQRKLNRVHNGVCPCCNRSFRNLRKHIQDKHPGLIKKTPPKTNKQ